jgi:hypothetical protein
MNESFGSKKKKHAFKANVGQLVGVITIMGVILAAVGGLWYWFGWRANAPKGQFIVMTKKTGKDLTNEDIMAPSKDYKGPQFEIVKEETVFRNPFIWTWTKPQDATVINDGEVGIMVRKYGDSLKEGQIITENENQKGIVRETLMPGRHFINHMAYDVYKAPMQRIRAGHRGIVTLMVGKESKNSNVFVVEDGERGTQKYLLISGTHPEYSNPYIYKVTEIDVRSQKFEMIDIHAVTIYSIDGFELKMEGTVEWAPNLEKLPELFVKYVDTDDLKKSGGLGNIEEKVILPLARSFSRIEGGKFSAVDYIVGTTRVNVQNAVEESLRDDCALEGVDIKAYVINKTHTPQKIRVQYKRREHALRDKDRMEETIKTTIGSIVMDKDGKPVIDKKTGKAKREGGKLVKALEELKKDRAEQLGNVRKQIVQAIRAAEKYGSSEIPQVEKRLAVAKKQLEAAKDKAARVVAQGDAKAQVEVMEYKAEVEGIKTEVEAFGDGEKWAEHKLIQKMAPGIKGIQANTEGSFAEMFTRFSQGSENSSKSVNQ